ncbi:MAG: terminase family protein [Candidatus Competibacter denitrificans]
MPIVEPVQALVNVATRRARHRLQGYKPYPKQKEFHAAGKQYRERLLRAGNQLGKTLAASMELAMHLTGQYPDGWRGRTWQRPIHAWAASETAQATRDNIQRLLLGRPGELGTGSIPLANIIGTPTAARGVAGLVDTVRIRHQKSGGVSTLTFKTYDQGRERWQGETLDIVAFDEEPPEDIYMEGLTRTNATGGFVWLTFTPLLGMSEVVRRFLFARSPDRIDINMTIDDAGHYTPKQRATIIASYPPHERDARVKGIPILGSGRIYPVVEAAITFDPFAFPRHWPAIAGLDFGWDHPTACVWARWDRDADTVYLYDAYRVKEATPIIHAAAIRARGTYIPIAWPHDGLQHSKDSGVPLATQYRNHGLNMLPEQAKHVDGSNGVEAGIMDMLDRMYTGRLKVARHLNDWWEEFRLYHRKDGKIVKEGDDLMDASRYLCMSLRFARCEQERPAETRMQQLLRRHAPGRSAMAS